jgi:hypothetical protein
VPDAPSAPQLSPQVQAGVVSGTVPLDCDAPAFNAERYEQDIWADIEQFIRDPREVLALLAAKRHASTEQQEASRRQLAKLQRALDALQGQCDDILALYRRQRISERDLDRQLDQIAEEEQGHIKTREALLAALQDASAVASQLETARTLLQQLHARLDSEPLTPALKRQIIRALVVEIRVEAVELGLSRRSHNKRQAILRVRYCFDPPAEPLQISAATRAVSQGSCRDTR